MKLVELPLSPVLAVMSVILQGELFSVWHVALAGLATLLVALVLANTDLFLTKSAPACLEELGAADLQTTTGGEQNGHEIYIIYSKVQISFLTLETISLHVVHSACF